MKRQAILFDLDGTLLPMDLDQFIGSYFKLLAGRFSDYEPGAFVQAVWKGTKAMVINDGTMTNEQRFWEVFCGEIGSEIRSREAEFADFYDTDFHRLKAITGENPLAKEMVALAHKRAERVILATNPVFPACGVASRLRWIGLSPEDFDGITSYENCSWCKPGSAYYREICDRYALDPARCLMVGNDLKDDGIGASSVGLSVHIVTDCLIDHGLQISEWSHSSFSDLGKYL